MQTKSAEEELLLKNDTLIYKKKNCLFFVLLKENNEREIYKVFLAGKKTPFFSTKYFVENKENRDRVQISVF